MTARSEYPRLFSEILFIVVVAVVLLSLAGCSSSNVPRWAPETTPVQSPPGKTVYFSESLKKNLVYLYGSTSRDVPLCLHGMTRENGDVLVDEVSFPDIFSQGKEGPALIETSGGENKKCIRRGRYLGMIYQHHTCSSPEVTGPVGEGFGGEILVVACSEMGLGKDDGVSFIARFF